MITSTMFRAGAGPCPICGAPNQTCTGAGARGPASVLLAPVPRVGPVYRSREQVWEVDPRTGHRVLKYGIGAEIPLAEAMRQGVVTEAQLTAEQRRQLAAHGLPARPPAAAVEEAAREGTEGGGAVSATVKAPKRPKADKMVRDAQTVQK